MRSHRPHVLAGLLAVLLATTLPGCSSRVWGPEFDATDGSAVLIAPPPVRPASPAQAVLALKWAIDHRSPGLYTDLLTADFLFDYPLADSAGNVYRGTPLGREDEAVIARHLFVTGTGTEPRALRARLTLPPELIAVADPRPGKHPDFHRLIETPAFLEVDTREARYRISTQVAFFLVRGDSAQIPPDLAARGLGPDASRWWIERWEELPPMTGPAPASSALPTRAMTWGALKLIYR